MIQAEGLTKHYGSARALAGVDLAVPAGTSIGVLGPNGAGKTTAIRILTTLTTPDAGRARVAGHDVVTEAAAVRRSIGVTAQDATVDEVLTGRQNLVMIGQLSGLGRRQAKARAAELLERFMLTGAADRVLKDYSGGMGRRLDLAASVVTRPPVLFLDEPTTGLDPASRGRMWDVIRELVADGHAAADHPVPRRSRPAGGQDRRDRSWQGHRGGHRRLAQSPDRGCPPGGKPDPAPHGRRDRAGAVRRRPVAVSMDGRRLRAGVPSSPGLATTVVRAFDKAGITVNDVAVHEPSLDDVFFPDRPAL
jgi:ABC-type Na+ transport system ATPase subunit NatA